MARVGGLNNGYGEVMSTADTDKTLLRIHNINLDVVNRGLELQIRRIGRKLPSSSRAATPFTFPKQSA